MTKAWSMAAIVAIVAGSGAWAVLRVNWSPPRPALACNDVFAADPTLEVPDDSSDPFRVHVSLRNKRPPAVAQLQIIDANGFGWVLRDLPADERVQHVVQLPRVKATHTVRTILLAPEEAERARVIRKAARAFDLRGWWGARGWLEPAATVCAVFQVAP